MVEPTNTALMTARDQLIELRTEYDRALAEFRWPDVGPGFNFAHDWFDPLARGNDAPALVIVEEDGSRAAYTFDELAHRSDQVAVTLRAAGIGLGDSVIVMLGNQVELWESMLAVIKIGAVIMPTTTAAGTDGAGRPDRARSGPRGDREHRRHGQVRRRTRGLVKGSSSALRPTAGRRTPRPTTGDRARRRASGQRLERPDCCSTSPAAPPAGRSWWSTPTAPTRSGTSRRCTGSGCGRETST